MQLCASQCYNLTQILFPTLNELGYEYWMDWGTLLGARREGTMIPHDYDADIGMRESQFQKLKQQWKEEPHKFGKMKLYKENNQLYRIRLGLGWVDVFRYDDDKLDMISMADVSHSCKCTGKGHKIQPHILFPLKTMPFGSVVGKTPQHVEAYLTHLYGQDWHIPRKNQVATLLNVLKYK